MLRRQATRLELRQEDRVDLEQARQQRQQQQQQQQQQVGQVGKLEAEHAQAARQRPSVAQRIGLSK